MSLNSKVYETFTWIQYPSRNENTAFLKKKKSQHPNIAKKILKKDLF